MKRPVAALLAAVVLFAAMVAMLVSLQRKFLFPRGLVRAPDKPVRLPEEARQIWVETPEGSVEGWYASGAGRSADQPGPAVIFAHGNGEVIDHWPELLDWYSSRGVSALLVEYRGYGRSEGDPTSAKITQDMERFREWLVEQPEVDGKRLIYHGRSLGGGAVCALARSHPPAALVLQSTFTSLADLAWEHYYVPSALLRDEFDNFGYLQQSEVPVLITHGSEDQLIRVEHARKNHRAAADSELVEIPGRGHNDAPMKWNTIEKFLQSEGLLDA